MKGRYAVLAVWDDSFHPVGWNEVLDGLTHPEAESVAKECRRLGAILASVHKTSAARKLAKNANHALGIDDVF